ncbi:MAG: hypothetical protein ACOCRK_05395 [bacterium]
MRRFNICQNVSVHRKDQSKIETVPGVVIDKLYKGIFKKYVVKYNVNGIDKVSKYKPTEIFVDNKK